ncbi:hypothetical protein LINGRAHAP2_LOCUS1021 [Linum grandiflorum]
MQQSLWRRKRRHLCRYTTKVQLANCRV